MDQTEGSPFSRFRVRPIVEPGISECRIGPVWLISTRRISYRPRIYRALKREEKKRTLKLGNTVLKTKPGLFSRTHFHDSLSDSVLEAA